jgi:hypothetical protein
MRHVMPLMQEKRPVPAACHALQAHNPNGSRLRRLSTSLRLFPAALVVLILALAACGTSLNPSLAMLNHQQRARFYTLRGAAAIHKVPGDENLFKERIRSTLSFVAHIM